MKKETELDLYERIKLDKAKNMILDTYCNDKVWKEFKKWFRKNYL